MLWPSGQGSTWDGDCAVDELIPGSYCAPPCCGGSPSNVRKYAAAALGFDEELRDVAECGKRHRCSSSNRCKERNKKRKTWGTNSDVRKAHLQVVSRSGNIRNWFPAAVVRGEKREAWGYG